MNINSASAWNTNFGRLYLSYGVRERLQENPSKEYVRSINQVKNFIHKNNYHKGENIDLILGNQFSDVGDRFHIVVSSKKEGTPNNPGAIFNVGDEFETNKKEFKKNFDKFFKSWDYTYSKEGLEEQRKLYRLLGII